MKKFISIAAATAAALLVGFFAFNQVGAHQDPANCNASGLQQFPSIAPAGSVHDGDVITYSVIYVNSDPDGAGPIAPCNITGANATLDLPGAAPVINVLTGAILNVGNSISCPGDAGCAAGPYTYVVNHADEVGSSVTAVFDITGVLHQDPDEEVASDHDTLSKTVIHPSTILTKQVDKNTVYAGTSVTYTYTETNNGDIALTSPSVTDDTCAPVVGVDVAPANGFNDGDTNANGILDPTENWVFTCSKVINGDTTNTAIGHGTDPTGKDVTWCQDPQSPPQGVVCDQDERAQATVNVIAPTTVTTINSSAATVTSGGSVTLTITEHNDGDVDLTNPHVVVDQGIETLDKNSASFTGVDGGDLGVLDPGETWTWVLSSGAIVTDTTYTATGHGTDPLGNDVTFCANGQPQGVLCDQDEQDSVSVEVVLGLIVEKTSRTAHVRDWNWTIDKSAATSTLVLAEGESFTVNYTVTVSAVAQETLDASGTITITNPAGNPSATITGVTDVLSVSGPATVNCPVTFPHVLAPNTSIICSYQIVPGAPTNQTNTATVATTGDVPGGSDTVPVTFDPPVDIDECIVVDDTYGEGPQGAVVCAGDGDNDETFNYAVTFGPQGGQGVDVPVVCGENNHPNIASYVTQDDINDTDEAGSDNWNVLVTVECSRGCTLTQGYWKTHSDKGPAPFDDNWTKLLNGADTLFLNLTGVTWYQLFWMPPAGGNAFIQLAHQWMAATLNVLNGASTTPEVDTALATGEDLLDFYLSIPSAKSIPKALQQQMRSLAGTLGSYNEGLIGPGHCDEQNPL